MFTEILWIKPKLKAGDVATMEATLSTRFAKVAKRFGGALKSIIKGTAFGIGVNLLAKLLNPLQELEEKIRGLLDKGQEFGDLGDRLGASPGQLKQVEDVAKSFGVKPEQFRELLGKFAESVETARREVADPFQERSEATKTLADLPKETDILKAFLLFTKKLQEEKAGPGRTTEVGGEKRTITGAQNAAEIERLVFGAQQFGAMRKFLEADVEQRAKDVGLPSQSENDLAVKRLLQAASQADVMRTANEARDFNRAGGEIGLDTVRKLEDIDRAEQAKVTDRLKNSFNDLASAKQGIQVIAGFVEQIQGPFLKGIGELPMLIQEIRGVLNSGFFRKWNPFSR